MIPALTALGIQPQVQQFFEPWLKVGSDEELSLTYSGQKVNLKKEEFITRHGSLVPSTTGIWCAGGHYPNSVRHNFLFYSGLEALSFCSIATDWLVRPGFAVFSALGLCPSSSQISILQHRFPNARLHTVFANDILGRVTDCKVALWSKRRDAVFNIEMDLIVGNYNGKIFRIPEPIFSLSLFEQKCGLRSGIRTHKPKAGISTFTNILRDNIL